MSQKPTRKRYYILSYHKISFRPEVVTWQLCFTITQWLCSISRSRMKNTSKGEQIQHQTLIIRFYEMRGHLLWTHTRLIFNEHYWWKYNYLILINYGVFIALIAIGARWGGFFFLFRTRSFSIPVRFPIHVLLTPRVIDYMLF